MTSAKARAVFEVMAQTLPRIRRKYRDGRRCQDCGYHKPVTTIVFWATGMKYVVCGVCIRAYRHQIMKMSKAHP